jgi:hypothetical protein
MATGAMRLAFLALTKRLLYVGSYISAVSAWTFRQLQGYLGPNGVCLVLQNIVQGQPLEIFALTLATECTCQRAECTLSARCMQ